MTAAFLAVFVEPSSLIRSLITITAVAAISCCLAHFENALGSRPDSTDWVRTADGWESSLVLQLESAGNSDPDLHPALVASFQLGVSLFALIAFPSRVRRGVQEPASAGRVRRVRVHGIRREKVFLAR